MGIGADGLKTGYTEESGYGLVGSALVGGQRLILVINGTRSEKERAEEARKLMDWGFRAFERVSYFAPGEPIGDARVFGGDAGSVGLVSKVPIDVLLPRGTATVVKGRIVYEGPVAAPVTAGQQIGTLRLTTADDQPLREAKLYASDDVPVGSVRQRALSSLRELLLGWW
jgi:D-alanyl-D-alanine carboxypeptidase (penicillin-binding protein 5/6)